jgi:hypothetical protein
VAVRTSREIVIDAPPEAILDALADIESVSDWSSVHKRAEVIDTYPDGRPHHVKVTVKVISIVDQELVECHWAPDWMVWDAKKTSSSMGNMGITRCGAKALTGPGCASTSPWNRQRRCLSFWSAGPARGS